MEFTDGTDFSDELHADDLQQDADIVAEVTPEPQTTPPQVQEIQPSPVPLPTSSPEQTEIIGELESDAEITPELSPTPEISYEDLVAEIRNQTEEIKTIQEKNEEHFQTYEHLGLASVVGIGLLFGGICALIMSQYIRH